MRLVVLSEVDFSYHHGIRRKYEALKCLEGGKVEKVEVFSYDTDNVIDKIGLFYFRMFHVLLNADSIYLRNNTRISTVFSFTLFLIVAKVIGIRLFIEIPTWPFISEEYSGLKRGAKELLFRFNRLVYQITSAEILLCSPNEFFNDMNYRRITNWLPVLSNDFLENSEESKKWDFVYMSNLNSWHNPELLLKIFHNSPYTLLLLAQSAPGSRLEAIIDTMPNVSLKYGLEEVLLFSELNSCRIGIDTVSRGYGNYSLKSRDYLACGLSVVYFHYDDYLNSLDSCMRYTSIDELNLSDALEMASGERFMSLDSLKVENVFEGIL